MNEATVVRRVESRTTLVVKVTKPTVSWREMYVVEGVGIAVHHAVRENA